MHEIFCRRVLQEVVHELISKELHLTPLKEGCMGGHAQLTLKGVAWWLNKTPAKMCHGKG